MVINYIIKEGNFFLSSVTRGSWYLLRYISVHTELDQIMVVYFILCSLF